MCSYFHFLFGDRYREDMQKISSFAMKMSQLAERVRVFGLEGSNSVYTRSGSTYWNGYVYERESDKDPRYSLAQDNERLRRVCLF